MLTDKQRLAEDTARQATSPEVIELRSESAAIKEVVAELIREAAGQHAGQALEAVSRQGGKAKDPRPNRHRKGRELDTGRLEVSVLFEERNTLCPFPCHRAKAFPLKITRAVFVQIPLRHPRSKSLRTSTPAVVRPACARRVADRLPDVPLDWNLCLAPTRPGFRSSPASTVRPATSRLTCCRH